MNPLTEDFRSNPNPGPAFASGGAAGSAPQSPVDGNDRVAFDEPAVAMNGGMTSDGASAVGQPVLAATAPPTLPTASRSAALGAGSPLVSGPPRPGVDDEEFFA